jgi:hypothetical protein
MLNVQENAGRRQQEGFLIFNQAKHQSNPGPPKPQPTAITPVDDLLAVNDTVDSRHLLQCTGCCLDKGRHETQLHSMLLIERVLWTSSSSSSKLTTRTLYRCKHGRHKGRHEAQLHAVLLIERVLQQQQQQRRQWR